MALMVNMQGYFFGHYPQHFELTDDQRNLILQTMMFVIWLAGGAGVFAATQETWSYVDALYFCDVTLLTVGFGDYYAGNDVGRGLVFPFSVGGIIILGLMVSSIQRFAKELSDDKIIKKHVESRRVATVGRSVTTSFEAERRREHLEKQVQRGKRLSISAPFNPEKRAIAFDDQTNEGSMARDDIQNGSSGNEKADSPLKRRLATFSEFPKKAVQAKPIRTGVKKLRKAAAKKTKLLILREERDRFDAMRSIQHSTKQFKKYSALCMSVIACMSTTNAPVTCLGTEHLYTAMFRDAANTSLKSASFGASAPSSSGKRSGTPKACPTSKPSTFATSPSSPSAMATSPPNPTPASHSSLSGPSSPSRP